jgi:CheY-like chemotaxis protein
MKRWTADMAPTTRQPPTLLVVEDDDAAREALAAVLRQLGFNVVTAADGAQGLDLLRSGPRPDLILLDMLLPVLDGWQFLRRLRQERSHTDIPVVITTGTILTREWATDHGCQGFLRKPIDLEQLLAEVWRCLG